MRKLLITALAMTLSLGATAALAQASSTGQMPTSPGAADPATSTTPGTMPADPQGGAGGSATASQPSGGMSNPGMSGGGMSPPSATPQTYPRCSATVHDECRQRK